MNKKIIFVLCLCFAFSLIKFNIIHAVALTPVSSCGNGICDIGEGYSNCSPDCGNTPDCVGDGGPFYVGSKCCSGLVAGFSNGCITPDCPKFCQKSLCGNGVCDTGETIASCSRDCEKIACVAEGQSIVGTTEKCCAGLVVSNGICQKPNGTVDRAALLKAINATQQQIIVLLQQLIKLLSQK